MSDIHESLSKFQTYFESKIEIIRTLPGERTYDFIKKLLYISVIDSIGGIAFPNKERKNRWRFSKTVVDFGEWTHASYFSLPHLYRWLSVRHDCYFDKLEKDLVAPAYAVWTDQRQSKLRLPWITTHGPRQILPLRADIPEDYVLSLVSKRQEDKINAIRKFQHLSLLYDYRNLLVHSLLIPGINGRPEAIDEPYYEEYVISRDASGNLHIVHDLIYPNDFLYMMALRILANVIGWFEVNNHDPWGSVQQSIAMYWDKKLNAGLGGMGEILLEMIRQHPRSWHPGGEGLPLDHWSR